MNLGRASPPVFGQISLWILLGLAFYLGTTVYEQGMYDGVRVGSISVAGLFPESVRTHPQILPVLWCVFTACAVFWACNWLIPFSSWGATIAFTLYISTYLENVPYWDHKAHLTNLVLFVYCGWYHCWWRRIREAAHEGRFWTTPLYPRWVYLASVFAIGCHYCLAGISKLIVGQGLLWADGLTLQMWVLARGCGDTPLGHFVVEHRTVAFALQAGALFFELTMPLALFFPWYRIAAVGFLTGFHLSSAWIFPDVIFFANLGVTWTFFLLYPLLERYGPTLGQRFSDLFLPRPSA